MHSRDAIVIIPLVAFLLLMSLLPTAVAVKLEPPGWQWTGILSRNTADFNGYMSIVEEIRQKGWRSRNLFTAEPQPEFQIRPYYMMLGGLGRLVPSVSNLVLMESGRIVAGLLFLLILFGLVRRIYDRRWERVVAFLTVAVGSGLGWLRLTPDPPDLRIVETSTALALISPPLYCVSLSLFSGILLALDAAWSERAVDGKGRIVAALAVAGLALWEGFDRPFALAPLWVSIGLAVTFLSLRNLQRTRRYLAPAVIGGCGACAAILYQLTALREIPAYSEWNRQHILPTPPPVRILLAFGLLLPLAFAGIRPLMKRKKELALLLCLYVPVSFVFSYLSFPFQERFLEGAPFCLALLAGAGLVALLNGIEGRRLRAVAAVLSILVLLPSTMVGFSRDIRVLARKSAPQYLPAEFLDGIRKLKEISTPDEAVLSTMSSGNFIPAYSGRPVVLGQQVQTAYFAQKTRLVSDIFHTRATNPALKELLAASRASWLFWGPEERILAAGIFQPDQAACLQKEFSNRLVTLYRIQLR